MKKLVCMILVGMLAQAASANLLVNGDFEQPVLAEGTEVAVSSGQVPGWSALGANSPAVGNYPGTFVGGNTAIAYTTQTGLMIQSVGEIQPNTTYTLSVDVGSSVNWYGLNTTAGVEIAEFSSGGLFLADLAYVGFGGPNPITDPGPGNSTNVTVTYTTGAMVTPGNQIVAVLGFNGAFQGGYGVVFDNAVMTPEPTTMGLLACGSLVGLLRRRNK